MTGDQLLSLLTWAIFAWIFALVVRTAIQRPLWANVNVVLLFAMPMAIIAIGAAAALGDISPGPLPNAVNSALLLAMSFFMLRLVDDFIGAPAWLLRASAAAFALLSLGGFALPPPRPPWFVAGQLVYFVGGQVYAAAAFARAGTRAVGITRRRVRAAGLGALLLGLTVAATALRAQAPWWQQVSEVAGLAAGVCLFVGFAPPATLRRSWQEPELRAFLMSSNELAHLADQQAVLATLEREAAAALGTQQAYIGLYDAASGRLDFRRHNAALFEPPNPATASGQAFLSQQPRYTTYRNSAYRGSGAALPGGAVGPRAVLAAPISDGERRFGVLTVASERAPTIGADDLELVALLAGQIAAMLATRALVDELARVRAEADANRLKEDFLSVAAHDLKTPLTTVIAQTQRLARKMRGDPAASEYLGGLDLVQREALRLRRIVTDLLDAERAERGGIISAREPVEVAAIAREIASRYQSPRHRIVVDADEPLIGSYDRFRIQQLLEHLLDNAVLYSPDGGQIEIRLRRRGAMALVTITDAGIGIPADDVPRLFGRFFRGSNVNDRQYPGLGLSLFICRAIVEQHGGRIAARSAPGRGTTLEVMLPLLSDGVLHAA